MLLPKINHPTRAPRYEQIQFLGIDRTEQSREGGIYDMCDITFGEYPVMATVPMRTESEKKYGETWYYGHRNKEFVIAGREEVGTDVLVWESGKGYTGGTIVWYNGALYRAKAEISADSDESKKDPQSYPGGWSVYEGIIFNCDGAWNEKCTTKGMVVFSKDNYYVNISGNTLTPRTDKINWGDFDYNYKRNFDYYTTYYAGDIVYHGSVYYLATAGSRKIYPYEDQDKWTKISWSAGEKYAVGDKIAFEANGFVYFRENLTGVNTSPATDSKNWELYKHATLYYGGVPVEGLWLSCSEKTCEYLNGNIVIYPDKVYYNTDTGDFGYMAGSSSGVFNTADYTKIYSNGKVFNYQMVAYLGSGTTLDGNKGTFNKIGLGFDSGTTLTGPVYNYVDVDLSRIFSPGDVVTVSQSFQKAYSSSADVYAVIINGQYVVDTVEKDALIFASSTFAGAIIGDDAQVGVDSANNERYYMGEVSISKGVPDFDGLCTAMNRMWGIKDYTVYGSELGNCFSWSKYTGLETDPTYQIASDIGNFVACCEYGDTPIFFKEHEAWAMHGSGYNSFYLTKIMDYGVQKGSEKSICVVDSVLYFLSPKGVCAYSGGIPGVISGKLKRALKNGIAGTDGKRYYLSVDDGDGRRCYVYDTEVRAWTSEYMEEKPLSMEYCDESLKVMMSGGRLISIAGNSEFTKEVGREGTRYIEFGDFYGGTIEKKDVGRILLRVGVNPEYGALKIFIQYDSDGIWHRVGEVYNQKGIKAVNEFGFFPRRCDHYRIRLECDGEFKLYSMAREAK